MTWWEILGLYFIGSTASAFFIARCIPKEDDD
jgi:hypothetical protein